MDCTLPSHWPDRPGTDVSPLLFYRRNMPHGAVSWVGDSEGLLGYAPAELPAIFADWLNLVHADDRTAAETVLLRPERTRAAPRYRLRGRDGAYRVVEDVAAFLIEDTLIGALRAVMELPELKSAEKDLVRFFDLSLDLFCIAKLDGYFVRVNSNFSRVLGYPENVLLSRPYLDFVHPDDRAASLAQLAKVASGLPVVQFRNRYLDSRGEYHWLEWTGRAIPEEGTIFAVARDISERVKMEKELLALEQRERAILDNSTAVIYVKGTDGKYQFVNRRYADLFALNRAVVIGKTDLEIFPRAIALEFQKNDRRVVETRETLNIQEVAPHADGIHTYVSVKFPLFDSAGQVVSVAGISTDITDQILAREAEQQLQLARVFQQKLYPAQAPFVLGLDVAGSAVPVAQVCGDYFDYILRAERRLAISVGDVSGHGFGAALQMVEVRAALRMLLREETSLDRIVAELNRMLCADLPESSFVSLFLAQIDVEQAQLRYVGAGHQTYLFRPEREAMQLASTGPLLGIDETATFIESALPLERGDRLLLFTDGLTDAMCVDGESFGIQRVLKLVADHRHETSQRIVQRLFEAVYAFARGRSIEDDITAISVKFLG